jgi:ATP-binding cassette subfamily B protein
VIVAGHHGLDLSKEQIVHDHLLKTQELSVSDLVNCATAVGLRAEHIQLDWNHLIKLKKAIPAIVRLKNGTDMVLREVRNEAEPAQVVLQDPNAGEHALLTIDGVRFEQIWGGDVVLVRRNYEIHDEAQPFSIWLIVGLVMRDRQIVRDIAICALILGLLALAPIMFWRLLMDKVLFFKSFSTFTVLCVAMAILVGFETAFYWMRRYLVLHLTQRVDVKLSTYVFDKLLNLPIDYFERTHIGDTMHRIGYLRKIREFLQGQVLGTVLDSTTLFFFLPLMFYFSPVATLGVLAVCLVITVWLLITLPIHRRKANALETAETLRGSYLVQSVHGIRTVKSLVLEARHRHHWDALTARAARLRFSLGMTDNLIAVVVRPLERLAVSGSLAVIVYATLVNNDLVYAGALFAFLMLTQRVVHPLIQIAQSIDQWDDMRLAIQVIASVANLPEEEGRSGHGVREPLKGNVQFVDVTFQYKGASGPALREISFDVPAGTSIGIVGRSGSGKTTVTRLLQRLHSNYEGLIKIDGVDVREYDINHLRRSLGVVLQENFLFSGTIRENIMAGKPDATFEEMVHAAQLAGAEEFIDRLPRGYESYVYEGSPNLSGGQRQRLAIARALILDPRIIILDEATSALDPESEAIINANLARIARGRVLIVVSHRLSSLVKSDAILVLDHGEVADVGKHDELLQRCEIYRDLWAQQHRHLDPAVLRQKPTLRNPSLV